MSVVESVFVSTCTIQEIDNVRHASAVDFLQYLPCSLLPIIETMRDWGESFRPEMNKILQEKCSS